MAGSHLGTIAILVGFVLILDSFFVIQSMFAPVSVTFVNGVELILGLVVIGVGIKARQEIR